MNYSKCDSAQDLQEKLLPLIATLQKDENEDTWLQLETAFKNFSSLVNLGACKYPLTFTKVKEICQTVCRSIQTERTRLSGAALEFLESLSKNSTTELQSISNLFVNDIIKICARTNKIFTTRAIRCLETFIIFSRCFDLIPLVCDYAAKDQSKILRKNISKVLLTIVENIAVCTNLEIKLKEEADIKTYFETINTAISLIAVDADVDVRTNAKSIFSTYVKRFPDNKDDLISKLDPIAKKYLKISDSSSSSSSVKSFLKPSSSSTGIPNRPPRPVRSFLNSLNNNLKAPTKGITLNQSKNENLNQNTSSISSNEELAYKPQPVRRVASNNPDNNFDNKISGFPESRSNPASSRNEINSVRPIPSHSSLVSESGSTESNTQTLATNSSATNLNSNGNLHKSSLLERPNSDISLEIKEISISTSTERTNNSSDPNTNQISPSLNNSINQSFFEHAPVVSLSKETLVNTAQSGLLPSSAVQKTYSSSGIKELVIMSRKRSLDDTETNDSNPNLKNFKLFTGKVHSVKARKLPIFGRSLLPVYISPKAQKVLPKKLAPFIKRNEPETEKAKAKMRSREIRRLTIIKARQLSGLPINKSTMTGLVLNSHRDSIPPGFNLNSSRILQKKPLPSRRIEKPVTRTIPLSEKSKYAKKNIDSKVPSYLRPTASSIGKNKESKAYSSISKKASLSKLKKTDHQQIVTNDSNFSNKSKASLSPSPTLESSASHVTPTLKSSSSIDANDAFTKLNTSCLETSKELSHSNEEKAITKIEIPKRYSPVNEAFANRLTNSFIDEISSSSTKTLKQTLIYSTERNKIVELPSNNTSPSLDPKQNKSNMDVTLEVEKNKISPTLDSSTKTNIGHSQPEKSLEQIKILGNQNGTSAETTNSRLQINLDKNVAQSQTVQTAELPDKEANQYQKSDFIPVNTNINNENENLLSSKIDMSVL
ncbi:CLIP-associated protein [Smittium culicis]|uniref:CLIP-associated protein n=1 Tax=Smittium culicis TaxID=133412 RepID=A0A1R1Y2M2_9FUNG|nr:CLIP-associated protein [Smittium culicis]